MIKFGLKCAEGHQFESWFEGSEAYEKLKKSGHINCAICGSTNVEKMLMTPQVRASREKDAKKSAPPALSAPHTPAEQAIRAFRAKLEANSENVGKDFADEARAIYYGEKPERAIYGEANPKEAKVLIEEGIPVAPLPWSSKETH